jgi:hypothetical protein
MAGHGGEAIEWKEGFFSPLKFVGGSAGWLRKESLRLPGGLRLRLEQLNPERRSVILAV